jgi:thiol-disulfide isomerase/thioredoxin
LVVAAVLSLSPLAVAQDRGDPARGSALKVGQAAAPLQVADWVKGGPIPRFESGKVYVVEFWAVWCGPCIANIPHLNALQKKYGRDGLVVIGMTSPDREAGYTGPRPEGNSLAMVREFVAKRGAGMDYPVAYDTPDRATWKALMGQRSGIPHAFLLDRAGKLVVDFHPTFLDDAIAQVLAGTWDAAGGHAKMTAAYQKYVYALNARKYETFSANYAAVAREFPGAAKRLYLLRFNHTLRAGDLPAAREASRDLIAQARELGDAKELGAAVRHAARELATARNSGVGGLLGAERVQDLRSLLGEMAQVAAEVAAGREPAALAAQAELAHLDGDLAGAVAWQEKAIAAMHSGAKGTEAEQRRLEELRKIFSDETRRKKLMEATGRPD